MATVPLETAAQGKGATIEIVRTDDGQLRPRPVDADLETIECGLVLRSVGYQAVPLPDVPFEERSCVLPNERGRVRTPEGEEVLRAVSALTQPRRLSRIRLPSGTLAAACLALAALSLLGPSQPTTDPWGWIVWGHQLVYGALGGFFLLRYSIQQDWFGSGARTVVGRG